MKVILGRDNEIKEFEHVMQSTQSEFIAVTGRRRIGKTFLVNQYFKDDICFYLTGVQNQPITVQLDAFTQELKKRTKKKVVTPKDWLEAFFMLRNYVESIKSKKKKVIFFDELPWMDTQRSGFIQIFAHFWNSWAGWTKDIVLIIAGSFTSWVVKKIFGDRGGFHNRVTKRIFLEPFNLYETEQFLKHKKIVLTRQEIALIYMAFGGIPFYLNQIEKGESAAQCIQRLCFDKGALLKTEFNNLYHSIFSKADVHLKIVKALANHNYGLSRTDLLRKAKVPNSGGSTKVLEELKAVGYITHMIPFDKRANGGKYILSDFYSKFYLQFIANDLNNNWIKTSNAQSYKVWCGYAFEWLCHYHADQVAQALGLAGVFTSSSYLTIQNDSKKASAQIDMIIDRADNALNLCEIKFHNTEYKLTKLESEKIKNKISQLNQKLNKYKSIFPTMITTHGCVKNMYYLSTITNQVTLDDLFLPLKSIYY